MIRKTFCVGQLGCNCTILADETTREAVVIDPGDEPDRILLELAKDELRCVGILHTHAHIDHIGGTGELARVTGAPTYLHEADAFLHQMAPQQARMIGLPAIAESTIDRDLPDAAAIAFGEREIGVIHTPGHSPGSVSFVVAGHDICLSGDTLFAGGIGRTDLWGGDFSAIKLSITDRLYTLNGAVEVVPGHGPLTTIDRERVSNPFVRA